MRVSQPGPVGQLGRLSETTIAFAGAKWAFLVQFSGAEVSLVSAVPCWGASSGVVGFNVAMLSRLVREKVRPACPDGGREREKVRPARSKHPKIGVLWRAGRTYSRKRRWRAVLGEFFRGNASGGGVVGEFFRGRVAGGAVLGEFFRGPAVVGSRGASCVAPRPW